MNKRLIVVLGMHRSGTSAITRGLKTLGVELGENLLPPGESNAKGFWEDKDIVKLNIQLIRQLTQGHHATLPGYGWHCVAPLSNDQMKSEMLADYTLKAADLLKEKTGHAQVFGVKDPRMCRLLPFWKDVFSRLKLDVSYIIVSRNPLSVAKSLAKRNGFQAGKCHYLWLEHMLPSMIETAGSLRLVVDYDLFMDQPKAQLHRISQKLGLTKAPFNESADDIDQFIDKSLCHSAFQPEDLKRDPSMPPDAVEAYDLFRKLAGDELSENDLFIQQRFVQLDQSLNAMAPSLRYIANLEDQVTTLSQTVDNQEALIKTMRQDIAEHQNQINSLHSSPAERDQHIDPLNQTMNDPIKIQHEISNSTLWRMTQPIRFMGLQHIKHALRLLPQIFKHREYR